MKPKNQMLAKIEARIEAKYNALFNQQVDMLLQIAEDSALIAADDVFGIGQKRAVELQNAYRKTVNEIAELLYRDADVDADFVYTREVVDRRLKKILGDKFLEWEKRYK